MWVGYGFIRDHVVPMVTGKVITVGTNAAINRINPNSKSLVNNLIVRRSVDGAVLSGSSDQGWAKYTLPKGLPGPGQRILAIENEPHMVDDFDGVIVQGYGAGSKKLLLSEIVVIKIKGESKLGKVNYHFHDADRAGGHYDIVVEGVKPGIEQWELHIPRGLYKGRYAFVSTDQGKLVVRMKDEGMLVPKPKYTLRPEDTLSKIDVATSIVERKIDGSLGNSQIGKDRVTFRSHREGGETYYDRLPALEFIRNTSPFWSFRLLYPGPDLTGTVFQGELVHPDGAARVSGILNSLPANAQVIQKLRGPVEYYVWDIVKYKGRDVTERSYAERRVLYQQAVAEIRIFNRRWHVVEAASADETALEFYKRVIESPLPWGEGVVVKSADLAPAKWDKVKLTGFGYFELVEVLPGEGKYANSVGRLLVRNYENNAVGEVGSLAVPDEFRQWMWDHRSDLVGDTVKIRSQEVTARGVPRAGVFYGFHDDEVDLLMQAESMAGGDPAGTWQLVYKLKSSAGWRRK